MFCKYLNFELIFLKEFLFIYSSFSFAALKHTQTSVRDKISQIQIVMIWSDRAEFLEHFWYAMRVP